MLGALHIIKRSDLHVSKEGDNFEIVEDLVHFVKPQSPLLVQLINVDLLRIDKEEAEAHDLNQHMLFSGCQIALVLEHLQAYHDDVAK